MHDETFQPLKQRRNRSGFKRAIDLKALAHQQARQASRDAGCRKQAYASKANAERALARIRSAPGHGGAGGGKKLCAVYLCPICDGQAWHLTSQEQRKW